MKHKNRILLISILFLLPFTFLVSNGHAFVIPPDEIIASGYSLETCRNEWELAFGDIWVEVTLKVEIDAYSSGAKIYSYTTYESHGDTAWNVYWISEPSGASLVDGRPQDSNHIYTYVDENRYVTAMVSGHFQRWVFFICETVFIHAYVVFDKQTENLYSIEYSWSNGEAVVGAWMDFLGDVDWS